MELSNNSKQNSLQNSRQTELTLTKLVEKACVRDTPSFPGNVNPLFATLTSLSVKVTLTLVRPVVLLCSRKYSTCKKTLRDICLELEIHVEAKFYASNRKI